MKLSPLPKRKLKNGRLHKNNRERRRRSLALAYPEWAQKQEWQSQK